MISMVMQALVVLLLVEALAELECPWTIFSLSLETSLVGILADLVVSEDLAAEVHVVDAELIVVQTFV